MTEPEARPAAEEHHVRVVARPRVPMPSDRTREPLTTEMIGDHGSSVVVEVGELGLFQRQGEQYVPIDDQMFWLQVKQCDPGDCRRCGSCVRERGEALRLAGAARDLLDDVRKGQVAVTSALNALAKVRSDSHPRDEHPDEMSELDRDDLAKTLQEAALALRMSVRTARLHVARIGAENVGVESAHD